MINDNELELWIEYKEGYNLEARDALIEKYLDYSYSIGLRIYRRYSDFINLDKEEIFGITSFALIKAIENFDHTKKIPFVKFLNKVMNWYIRDEFSKYMNVSIRDQLKIFKKISENKSKDLLKFVIGLSFRNMSYINQLYENTLVNSVVDDIKNSQEKTEINEFLELVRQAMENELSDNEREVLKKMYNENKKLSTVSKEMGLSKQRINQIHRSALAKIKNFLKRKIL